MVRNRVDEMLMKGCDVEQIKSSLHYLMCTSIIDSEQYAFGVRYAIKMYYGF